VRAGLRRPPVEGHLAHILLSRPRYVVHNPHGGFQLPTLQVVIASTRPGRVGLPVGEWFIAHALEHGKEVERSCPTTYPEEEARFPRNPRG
jgi:hypothetical protein